MQDIPALYGLLESGALEVGQVLAGEGEDGGSGLGGDGPEVGGGGLVAVGGSPEGEVGDGAEVGAGFDRLVGGAVFAETDGVVGC